MKSKLTKIKNRIGRLDGPQEPIILQIRLAVDRDHYKLGDKYIIYPGQETEVIPPEEPEKVYTVEGVSDEIRKS